MRKINKYIVLTAILSLGVVSCNDEQILDLQPQSSLDENIVFSNPANITAAMNGMYQAAQIGAYNG